MPTRFYRRVRLGKGATLNVGKTGVSLSLGVRGAHITLGGAGGTRATVGIPGTGLFWTQNFTAEEKRQARYEAKRQRDAAHEAERQQKARARERKRKEREQAIEKAVREKKLQLAAMKSEFDAYDSYIATLSNFHKIDMICGEQAHTEFKRRCEPRTYQNESFPFEDIAKKLSVYRYPASDPGDRPIEDILRSNNEKFRELTSPLPRLRTIASLKEKIAKNDSKLTIPAATFLIGLFLLFFSRQVGASVAIISFIVMIILDKKYEISKSKEHIKSLLQSLGMNKKTYSSKFEEIDSTINRELDFYATQKNELDYVRFFIKYIHSQWTEEEREFLSFVKNAFQEFLDSRESEEWEKYEKKQKLVHLIELHGEDFYNWIILQACFVCSTQLDGINALQKFHLIKENDDQVRTYLWRLFLDDTLPRRFSDPAAVLREYESDVPLRENFEHWMNPEQHKRQWLENEAKRTGLLQKAGAFDREAISVLCEALLPLSIDIVPPTWIDVSSLQQYEVAYHVETPEEAWLLIELPDIAIIPEHAAQLSPGGNKLSYPAMTERTRLTLYDKFAASFSLIHVQLLYMTFPFFKKIWIEAYATAVDSATGMPRRKDIVQGYVDTENFAKFNFNNTNPVEAIKALKVNFFPFSAKQFVEPAWADDSQKILWASRHDDVPDGLLPF